MQNLKSYINILKYTSNIKRDEKWNWIHIQLLKISAPL